MLSVGTLHWIKNFEDGIRAVALLAADGIPVRYEIAGAEPPPGDAAKPSDRPKLLYLIRELGLEGRVELLGELSHEEVRDRMQASDVLLHPSLSEGIPNCVLEAMACELPVVVTDCGGMREAVTDGVEGFVCPPRDPGALAGALEPALATIRSSRCGSERPAGAGSSPSSRSRPRPRPISTSTAACSRLGDAFSRNGRSEARTIPP